MTISWNGKTLKELLGEDEKLYKETGHYYGIKELKLKQEEPLKYERFHSRLLTATIGAREAVKYVAASPAVREYGELVFGLYTPEGDAVTLSTGIMVHVHTLSAFAKWMIRNDYEDGPGIREGDVFANNETWAGGVHTADVQTLIPIFHERKLIGWAGGVTHELEAGAHEHGSMTIFAPERFGEGYHISAEKVGENDDYYKYHINKLQVSSRMPNWWILDEKARLAGCIMIREEVKRVIKEFGIDYYMKAVRELIEENRRAFLLKVKERLVPGRYKAAGCTVLPFKGIPHIHPLADKDLMTHVPIEVTVKEDGGIHIDFDGASRWGYHPYNCTPSAMDGGLWILITQILAYDGKVNDGAYLTVSQHLPKGSIVNTDYPYAATSITWATLIPTYANLGMLLSIGFFARGFLEEVFLPSAANSLANGGGISQFGTTIGLSIFEMAASQSGARAVIDGIDSGYAIWNPEADQGNAELWELLSPILYLGRRYIPDTHGYGRYRGGSGWASQWMLWKTEMFNIGCFGHVPLTPYVKGLFGGYPGPVWYGLTAKDTNIRELITKTQPVPHSPVEAVKMAESGDLKAKNFDVHSTAFWKDLKQYDLFSIFYTGGAGYGDPAERNPELVRSDLNNGLLSKEIAKRIYGVEAYYDEKEKTWRIDSKATQGLRREIKKARLKRGIPVKEWWKKEREKVAKRKIASLVRETYRESMELSEKFAKEFREFWQLPENFVF